MTKQIKGVLGTKLGMTQVWNESGKLVPVTVIEVAPNVVTVSVVLRRPAPLMRTHTLASFFEISRPAQRE